MRSLFFSFFSILVPFSYTSQKDDPLDCFTEKELQNDYVSFSTVKGPQAKGELIKWENLPPPSSSSLSSSSSSPSSSSSSSSSSPSPSLVPSVSEQDVLESKHLLEWMFRLVKHNMELFYDNDWDDVQKVRELRFAFFSLFFSSFPLLSLLFFAPPILKLAPRNHRAFHLIAREKETNNPVAFCHYRFDLEDKIDIVYLYEIQLTPHAQGRGLGGKLLALVEDLGAHYGLQKIMLTVQTRNKRARNFYQKNGYKLDYTSPQGREAASCGFRVLSKPLKQSKKKK